MASKNTPRTLRYDRLNKWLGHLAISTVTKGKPEVKNYFAERDAADADLFEVRHFAGEQPAGEPDAYLVCIRAGEESCECKGHQFRKSATALCRHVAALKKLRELGRV